MDPRHQLRESFLFYIYCWLIYLLLFIVAQAGADLRHQLREPFLCYTHFLDYSLFKFVPLVRIAAQAGADPRQQLRELAPF